MNSDGEPPANDHVLPQDERAEAAVLGSILIENSRLAPVREILAAGEFCKDAHTKIFRTMEHLADEGIGIDEITVKDELAQTGELEAAGGPAYIASLADG